MRELILKYIYGTCSDVEQGIEFGASLDFKNTNIHVCQNKALFFQKETLLHLFIQHAFLLSSDHLFYNMPETVCESPFETDSYHEQFSAYGIGIDFLNLRFDKNGYPLTPERKVISWYKKNRNKFEVLSKKICPEVFYVLFSNKSLLHKFNENIARDFSKFQFQKTQLTAKGKIKRVLIPRWVKKAVFHRDKGICSFCQTDLTNVFNLLSNENYDHIIPLDLFGVNDPTNIQLLCEKCNRHKLNKTSQVGKKYQEWF